MRKIEKPKDIDSMLPFLFPEEFNSKICESITKNIENYGRKDKQRFFVWTEDDCTKLRFRMLTQPVEMIKNQFCIDEMKEVACWIFNDENDHQLSIFQCCNAVGIDHHGYQREFLLRLLSLKKEIILNNFKYKFDDERVELINKISRFSSANFGECINLNHAELLCSVEKRKILSKF